MLDIFESYSKLIHTYPEIDPIIFQTVKDIVHDWGNKFKKTPYKIKLNTCCPDTTYIQYTVSEYYGNNKRWETRACFAAGFYVFATYAGITVNGLEKLFKETGKQIIMMQCLKLNKNVSEDVQLFIRLQ